MRRILSKQAPLFQGRHHQRYVPLFEVAHAAVNQLRTAAAGSFAKVVTLNEHNIEPARRCVHGDAHARCAASNDGNVPRLLLFSPFPDLAHHLFPAHLSLRSYSVQFFDRSTARCQSARRSARSGSSIFGSNRTSLLRLDRKSSGPAQNPVASPAR